MSKYLKRRESQAKSRRPKFTIRPLGATHLNALLRMERRTFSDPWTPGFFIDAMSHSEHPERPEDATICWGCWRGGKLVGYLIALPLEDSLHIANLAVTRRFRRQGLGRRMMRKLYPVARARKFKQLTLETRPSNREAIAFYESEGFRQIGVEKGYYLDEEDAWVMGKRIIG